MTSVRNVQSWSSHRLDRTPKLIQDLLRTVVDTENFVRRYPNKVSLLRSDLCRIGPEDSHRTKKTKNPRER
jgi:hypothetical protein